MQKLINVLSVASFLVSGSIVAGGGYVYLNRDAIVDNVKAQVMEAATGAITDGLVGGLTGGLGADLPIGGSGGGETGGLVPALPSPVMPF